MLSHKESNEQENTAEAAEALQKKITENINKLNKTLSKLEQIAGISTKLTDTGKLSVNIYFIDRSYFQNITNTKKIPPYIINAILRAIKPHQLTLRNPSIDIKVEDTINTPFEVVSDLILAKFVLNCVEVGIFSLLEGSNISKKAYQEKIKLLRLYFESAVFTYQLIANFPDMGKCNDLIQSTQLGRCFNQTQKEYYAVNDDISAGIDQCIDRMCQYTNISKNDESCTFHWDEIVRNIILSSSNSNLIWSRLQFVQTLLEDIKEGTQQLIYKMETLLKKFTALQIASETIDAIFSGIPLEDQQKLIGTSSLHSLLPSKQDIQQSILNNNVSIQRLNINIKTYDIGIDLIKFHAQYFLCIENNDIETIQSVPAQQNIEIKNVEDDLKKNISKKTPLTMFANEYLPFQGKSTFSEVRLFKEEARKKILQMETREWQRKQRNNNNKDESTKKSPSNINIQAETNNRTVYIVSNEVTTSAEIFPIANTKHLYLICDNNALQETSDKQKFIAFKRVALQVKLLSRDSLGASGIKLYGLNCLIIKCKEYPAEHLLCIAHPIADSNDYVYIPETIITHKQYEDLLNNRKHCECVANKYRRLVSVSFTQELSHTNVFDNRLK